MKRDRARGVSHTHRGNIILFHVDMYPNEKLVALPTDPRACLANVTLIDRSVHGNLISSGVHALFPGIIRS